MEAEMATIQRRSKAPGELKKERLELRIAASTKDLIQRAMAVSGLSAGDLAYEGARRILEEHDRMVLSGADREVFLDALIHPKEPAAKLVAALRRHKDLAG